MRRLHGQIRFFSISRSSVMQRWWMARSVAPCVCSREAPILSGARYRKKCACGGSVAMARRSAPSTSPIQAGGNLRNAKAPRADRFFSISRSSVMQRWWMVRSVAPCVCSRGAPILSGARYREECAFAVGVAMARRSAPSTSPIQAGGNLRNAKAPRADTILLDIPILCDAALVDGALRRAMGRSREAPVLSDMRYQKKCAFGVGVPWRGGARHPPHPFRLAGTSAMRRLHGQIRFFSISRSSVMQRWWMARSAAPCVARAKRPSCLARAPRRVRLRRERCHGATERAIHLTHSGWREPPQCEGFTDRYDSSRYPDPL